MTIDLSALGWDAARATAVRPGRRPGRVAWADRGVCAVLGASGPVRASLGGAVLASAARDRGSLPCPGDWVLLGTWPDGPVTVETVLPRRTVLAAPGSGRVLAANLDAVAVVVPAHPAPDVAQLRRSLSLVHSCGLRPLVVLSGADLADETAAVARRVAVVAPGVPVLPVGAERGADLDPLRAEVGPGRTLGLLTEAGADGSSLVDALVGVRVMPATVRRIDGTGRHTPCPALVPVPGGGALLDTGRGAAATAVSWGNAPTRDSVVPRG